jgi:hypothetical protein
MIAAAICATVAAEAGAQAPGQPTGPRPLPTVLPIVSGAVTTRSGVVSIAGRGDAEDPAVVRAGEREVYRSVAGALWIVAAWRYADRDSVRYTNRDSVLIGEGCNQPDCATGTGAFLTFARVGNTVVMRRVADPTFVVDRTMTAQSFVLIPAGIVFPATLDTAGAAPRWTRRWFDLLLLQAATAPVTPPEARALTCRAAFRGINACAGLHCRGDSAFPGPTAAVDRLRSYLEAKLQGPPPAAPYDQRVVAMLPAQDGFWTACARACVAGGVREADYSGFEAAACGR